MIKTFNVYSSDGVSIYEVIVEWNGRDLSVACNCMAGEIGKWCRHKESILIGDRSVLAVPSDLTEVLQWVKGSPVNAAMSNIRDAEAQQKEVEVLLKKAKAKVNALKNSLSNLVKPT